MARSFNGTDQDLYSHLQTPVNGPPMTISAWVNMSAATSGIVVGTFFYSTNWFAHYIYFNGTQLQVNSADNNVFGTGSALSCTANTLTHVAGVWTSATSRNVYVNGTAGTVDTSNITPSSTPGDFVVASRVQLDQYATGIIGEIAAWDAVLDPDEITALSKMWSAQFIRPASRKAYWRLAGYSDPALSLDPVPYLLSVSNAPPHAEHMPIIYPRKRHVSYDFSAGGTNVSPTVSVDSFVFSLQAVTVAGAANATASVESFVFTLPAVTVTGTASVSVTAVAITFNSPAVTVDIAGSANAIVSVDSVTFNSPAVTVTAVANPTATATVGSFTFNSPAVTVTGAASVSASVVSITFNSPAVTVTVSSASVSVSVAVDAITFSSPAASVSSGFDDTVGAPFVLRFPSRTL